MKKRNLTLLILLLVLTKVSSQHLYKEKFEKCDLEQFTLESDNVTAKKGSKDLLRFLTSTISEDIEGDLSGALKFQIIVYKGGKSCLLSYENETNFSSSELGIDELKNKVDSELLWKNESKNVCSLVEITFSKGKSILKRYGIGGKRGGIHELKN